MRLNSHQDVPQPVNNPSRAPKRRHPWGKYIYFSLLFFGALALGQWGLKRHYYVQAPGKLTGVEVKIESPIKAAIQSLPFTVGDVVNKNTPLAILQDIELEEKISQQQGKIDKLQAEEDQEKKQISILVGEQKSQFNLAYTQAQRKKDEFLGQIELLQFQEKRLQEKNQQLSEIFQQAEKLYQLGAISRPHFKEAESALTNNRGELKTLSIEIRTWQKKLDYGEKEIVMFKEQLLSLEQNIMKKSQLPVLAVEKKTAQEQLTILHQSLKERTLRTPQSGVISQVFKKTGEVVIPGEPLVSIADPESVFVKAYFPQNAQVNLHLQEPVELLFDNGRYATGTISKFYPATASLPEEFREQFRPEQETIIAEITLKSKNIQPVTLGMGVQVKIFRTSSAFSDYPIVREILCYFVR